jgi:hypothetical protein
MLFDTDVLVWLQRGNQKAAKLISNDSERYISVLTYMELLQNARDKSQHRIVKSFLKDFNLITLPVTENIGHRAAVYIEEYTLSSGIRAADALIAATAVENNLILSSVNSKHFKIIRDLQFYQYRP